MLCVLEDVPSVLSVLPYIGLVFQIPCQMPLSPTFRMPGVSVVLDPVSWMVVSQYQETQSAQTTLTVSVGEPKGQSMLWLELSILHLLHPYQL